MEPPADSPTYAAARERPDLLLPTAERGMRIVQLTDPADGAFGHIYMESHVLTPDGRFLVLQHVRDPDAAGRGQHRTYLLCDMEDGYRLRAVTDEEGAAGPSVSPDGAWLYYLVDHTKAGGGAWSVRRVELATLRRETLATFDGPLPGAGGRHLSRLYPLTSISSDGGRLCGAGFLGDGASTDGPFGLFVFDVATAEARVVLAGPDYCNLHPQYCRSRDAEAARDILAQHNHGCVYDAGGRVTQLTGEGGADIHVIRDDGTHFRSLPWGRDGRERCQGHQAWRGELRSAVTSLGCSDGTQPIVEGWPVEVTEETAHSGALIPGGRRSDPGRHLARPGFVHFGFDATGTRFISDISRRHDGIVLGTWPADEGAHLRLRFLLHHGSSFGRSQLTHPHPFLSADGERAFFNSDEPGQPAAFAVEGLTYPA